MAEDRIVGKPGSVYDNLDGVDRDVAIAIVNLFTQYGLESLAPKIVEFVRQGYSSDTISVLLQDTNEYKERFAANADRKKRGLPVLSPAEYLSVENSYRQIMAAAGLPPGFYDSVTDFQGFIGNDLSPTELKSRVDVASEAIYKSDPNTLNYFKQWYSTGDMIAYALDPKRAEPIVERNIKAAQAAATAQAQGIGISRDTAEDLGRVGVTQDQMRTGFGYIGQEYGRAAKLANLYGENYTADDLTSEVFLDDANAANKRRKLASAERGSFGGSSGQSKSSLSRTGSGNI